MNSNNNNSPKITYKIWVGPSSTYPPSLSPICNIACPKKSKKLVQQTPIITTRQKITHKIWVGPSSTHRVWATCNLARPKKIKETRAANSNNNNSPKKYSQTLSWTKFHPPSELEPHVSYRLREKAHPKKSMKLAQRTSMIRTPKKITQKI